MENMQSSESQASALLEEQGKIDFKKPVPFYIEELKGSDWDETTGEDALDMANGLDSTEHNEELQDTRTDPDRGYFKWSVTLGFLINPDQKEKDPIEVLGSMKRKYPGHTAFEYNSINTFVMNRINERIGGKPINELFSEVADQAQKRSQK
jgi:CubicO group peptidase (beta-lactamase class C family)